MATVTGLTAARMLEIEGESIVDAEVVGGELILIKHDGTQINVGSVNGPEGPVGPEGPAGGLIPGEIRLWPGTDLPLLANYGRWTWADGAFYAVADYPLAAAHIASAWRTFGGASDPGGSNFRVPDMRGLVPAGLDAMPGGARANRMTRSVAIVIAGKSGEETHIITLPESAPHAHGGGVHGHGVNDGGHAHGVGYYLGGRSGGHTDGYATNGSAIDNPLSTNSAYTGISIQNSAAIIASEGGGGAHENVQPTVFVPYIVKLDD